MSRELRCPVCSEARLDDQGRCAGCGGGLVSDAAVELERVGVERAILTQLLAEEGTRGHPCPVCDRAMTRAPVRGEMIDVCEGCGALWADRVELARVYGAEVARSLLATLVRRKPTSGSLHASPLKYLGSWALLSGFGTIALDPGRAGIAAAVVVGLGVAMAIGWLLDIDVEVDADAGTISFRSLDSTSHHPLDEVRGVRVGERTWYRYPVSVLVGDKTYVAVNAATRSGAIAAGRRIARLVGLPPESEQVP